MNHIANTLISALRLALRNQTADDRDAVATSSMQRLDAAELSGIVGGDDTTGPRGGWIATATTML